MTSDDKKQLRALAVRGAQEWVNELLRQFDAEIVEQEKAEKEAAQTKDRKD